MFDEGLAAEIMKQILAASERVLRRTKTVKKADDFLKNERALERLDSVCMLLIAIGESIKNFDKITNKNLLKNYHEFEWKKAMGMRDILSHHYFDLNSEVVFDVCKNEIPKLQIAAVRIIVDLQRK